MLIISPFSAGLRQTETRWEFYIWCLFYHFFYYNYRNISPKLMIVFATDIFMYVCNLRSNTLICLIRLTHTFPKVCDEKVTNLLQKSPYYY